MAASTIAGAYGGGIRIPCILYEGTVTVTANTFGPDGLSDSGLVLSAGLVKGDIVTVNQDTANTYSATGGIPVVERTSNGDDYVMGQIVSNPEWVVVPTSTQSTWSSQLTYKYYRVATVEFWSCNSIQKATLVSQGNTAITPGVTGDLEVNVTNSLTNHSLYLNDTSGGTGGAGIFSFHYHANTAGETVSLLVGITGTMNAST